MEVERRISQNRVMIFVDASNFYHHLKSAFGEKVGDRIVAPKFHYAKLADFLCGPERRLVHTHVYTVPIDQKDDPKNYAGQQRFFNSLRQLPSFILHLGRLVERTERITCTSCHAEFEHISKKEKAVDVHLATDMLMFAFDNAYDTAIIMSADGDYAPVVAEVKRLRKRVENANVDTEEMRRAHLVRVCDDFIPITKDTLTQCDLLRDQIRHPSRHR